MLTRYMVENLTFSHCCLLIKLSKYTHHLCIHQRFLVSRPIKFWFAALCPLKTGTLFLRMVEEECQKDPERQTERFQYIGYVGCLDHLETPKCMCL